MDAITSVHNPKVKHALKLWKRSARDESGSFLIEGFRELSRASAASIRILTLFICPELFLGENEQELIRTIQLNGARVFSCTRNVFQKLSYRDRPDGLIAVAGKFHFSLDQLLLSEAPFFVVAEGIEKPGNLGTILRSCDGAGADAVIVCDKVTDIFNPNVVRASVGTLFTRPVIETSSRELIEWLKERAISIVSATPSAEKVYTDIDLSGPIALVVGAEQYGLKKDWLEAADVLVKIPMRGEADSLNVAMATTILLYEAARQRNHSL